MENIEQRVKKIVAEQLGVNEADIKIESAFVEDLGADSLDTVELVMALEDEFECEIPGRRSRENPHRAAGHRLHQFASESLTLRFIRVTNPEEHLATPPRSGHRPRDGVPGR